MTTGGRGGGEHDDADGTDDPHPVRLRPLEDEKCACQVQPAQRDAGHARAPGANGRLCDSCGLPRCSGERLAGRSACRFRVATKVVPEGSLVRHPRCPRCGERLAYRGDRDRARFLHAHDPQFRLTVVS
jgi:hypothetical protein